MTQTTNYRKSYNELMQAASMMWPAQLIKQAVDESIIPLLLETQENVIGILTAGMSDLNSLLTTINLSRVPNNLFIRHLMVLCDVGGENLSSINSALANLLPDGILEFEWDGRIHHYTFNNLGKAQRLTNYNLGVTAKQLHSRQPYKWPEGITQNNKYSAWHKDIIALLLFGSSSINPEVGDKLQKCKVGEFLGENQAGTFEKFIRERYIWVSRQAGGSISNKLGSLAEKVVLAYLEKRLTEETRGHIHIEQNGVIPSVRDNERGNLIKFDILATNGMQYVAIEVSFQETTNSVVERKRGQAQTRYEAIEQTGNKLAYIIDGAGNFRRRRFIEMLCEYSHCTVAFTPEEFEVLYQFITTTLAKDSDA